MSTACRGRFRPSRRSATEISYRRARADGSSPPLVMLVGIGFLTVITAAITSTFIEARAAAYRGRSQPTRCPRSSIRSARGWR